MGTFCTEKVVCFLFCRSVQFCGQRITVSWSLVTATHRTSWPSGNSRRWHGWLSWPAIHHVSSRWQCHQTARRWRAQQPTRRFASGSASKLTRLKRLQLAKPSLPAQASSWMPLAGWDRNQQRSVDISISHIRFWCYTIFITAFSFVFCILCGLQESWQMLPSFLMCTGHCFLTDVSWRTRMTRLVSCVSRC